MRLNMQARSKKQYNEFVKFFTYLDVTNNAKYILFKIHISYLFSTNLLNIQRYSRKIKLHVFVLLI